MPRVVPALVVLPLLLMVSVLGACRAPDMGPAVAVPALALSRTRVPLGGPVEITYQFAVLPGIGVLTEPYRVYVDFLDPDRKVMFTDDHAPPVATTDWQSGQIVTYERRLFIPLYPYVGEAAVALRLVSPSTGDPVALVGEHVGQGRYVAATVELAPPSTSNPTFRGGWYPRVRAEEGRWSTGDSTIVFERLRQDSILYLELEGRPSLFESPQRVDLLVGGRTIDSFLIEEPGVMLHTTPLRAADFDDGELVALTLHVDSTFVPAELPGSTSVDKRRLAVRVFHAFIESQ